MFKLVHLEDRSRFLLVPVNRPYQAEAYDIDGQVVVFGPTDNSAGVEMWTAPLAVCKIHVASVVTHYANASGDTIGAGAYHDEAARLNTFVEDMGWPSIDDEFAYRRYVAQWTPITKSVVQLSDPLPLALIKTVAKTANPHVQSLYSYEGALSDQAVYHRLQALIAAFRRVCMEAGLKETTDTIGSAGARDGEFSVPSHSGLRFGKVHSTYLFDDSFEAKFALRGTMESLLQKAVEDEASVRRKVLACVAAKSGKELPAATAEELLAATKGLIAYLGETTAKSSSSNSLGQARRQALLIRDRLESDLARMSGFADAAHPAEAKGWAEVEA